jgi:hypothetical protein
MSWKSYAAVSGATVLAGWLASAPPANEPEGTAAVAPGSRQPAAARRGDSDIAREAERLQERGRRDADYTRPRRNPFRFSSRAADDRGGDIPNPAPAPPPAIVFPVIPAPPPLRLSGIAEDQQGQQLVRTAILSSPAGVLLVHEGDTVLADYRVGRIESEAVELVKSDGTTLRLTLSTRNSQ